MWSTKLKINDTLKIGEAEIIITNIEQGVVSVSVQTENLDIRKRNAKTMEEFTVPPRRGR